MRTVGILGGLGPESTVIYYKEIVGQYRAAAGTDDFPHILINSINMTHVLNLINGREYDRLVRLLADEIEHLAAAGAELCAIASNTPHVVFDRLAGKVNVPMVSIVEATAARAHFLHLKRVLLIGTRFTMQNDFYARCFREKQITVIVPEAADQEIIHSVIFPELESGIVRPEKKRVVLDICTGLIERDNLDGIILGCTELPLMLKQDDFSSTVLDTVRIHVEKLVSGILGK
ncbi:MAG: amino acid racemase [Chitinispirillaceae bacterium]|nr:amino acid racemase [Chitinispirillaceae bacterium]